jgi:hypothetical protein
MHVRTWRRILLQLWKQLKHWLWLFLVGCGQQTASVSVDVVQTTTQPAAQPTAGAIRRRAVPDMPKNLRTPAQIAQTACTRHDGTWACGDKVKPALKLGAAGSASPISWTVPFWAVDPQNATTCASDGNTCTSATCSGSGTGPCLTYGQIVQRWGTTCPQISAITQVEFLSGQSIATDPVELCAFTVVPSYIELFAPVPVVCTATLSNVTPKNRATGQLLQAQAGACFTGKSLMVTNVTHPSVAWTYQNVSGSTYSLTPPANNTSYVAVDTWANGDTVQVGTPFQVNIRNVNTNGSAVITGFGFSVWVHDVIAWAPNGSSNSLTITGGGIVYMHEVNVEGGELYTNNATFSECDNCDFAEGTEINILGSNGESPATQIWGVHRSGINKFGNAAIGGDIILGSVDSGQHFVAGAHVGSVYLASGATLIARADSEFIPNFEGALTGAAIAWGPGIVQSIGSSKFSYPSIPTNVFLNSGGLSFDTTTTGCAFDTSVDPALWHCNRNLTAALLGTAIGSGGFNNCAWSPHGARICVP